MFFVILDKETVCHLLICWRTFIWSLLQKEVLYQSQCGGEMGEISQEAQLVLKASCKLSFIPHAQSHAATEEQGVLSAAEKLLLPVPYKCLVKHNLH